MWSGSLRIDLHSEEQGAPEGGLLQLSWHWSWGAVLQEALA